MRSIETLVREFPEKTGSQILDIQEADKLIDEKNYQEENKEKLKWIEDINTNGGFFRGRFGSDQRFYYKVTNCLLESCGSVYCDVEKIVVFLGKDKNDRLNIERRMSSYTNADTYGFNVYERVTEKEWNEVNTYLEGVEKFWSELK